MLLEGLPEQTTTFDVVTHSRGGLVLRNLVERSEQFGAAGTPLQAGPRRARRVAERRHAARHAGALGRDRRLVRQPAGDSFRTTRSRPAPRSSPTALVWLANHASGDLPGLHSMDRRGEPIADASTAARAAGRRVFGAGLELSTHGCGAAASAGRGHRSVLRVRERSRRAVGRRMAYRSRAPRSFRPARIGCFGPGGNLKGDEVTHVNFFAQQATTDFLVNALARPKATARPGRS